MTQQPFMCMLSVIKSTCQVTHCGQFGFMPGKRTTDAIFIMRHVQEKHLAKKRLYCAFVDIEVVRWALRKLGVDKWLIRTVMALYTEACTVVKTDAGLSDSSDSTVVCCSHGCCLQ